MLFKLLLGYVRCSYGMCKNQRVNVLDEIGNNNMKNVNDNMLKKCIFLTQEEYEGIVLSVCGQHSEYIPFDKLSSVLAEYFRVEEILSIHKDDSEMECVWICYKNSTEKYVLMHTDGYSISTNIFSRRRCF